LILSFVFILIKQPKFNNIPVVPVSFLVELNQNEAGELTYKSSALVNGYPRDYQLNSDSNYYTILLKKSDTVLFTGKTIKSLIIVSERKKITGTPTNTNNVIPTAGIDEKVILPFGEPIGNADEEPVQQILPLNDFELNLPYYKDATELVIQDEEGNVALSLDLTTINVKQPEAAIETCGDGICSDHENIFMCRDDCSYSLRNIFKK
jgi:hypothetical protein